MDLNKKHSIDSEIGGFILPAIFLFLIGSSVCIHANYFFLILWIPFYTILIYWILLQQNRLVLFEEGFILEYVIKKGKKTNLISYEHITLLKINCNSNKGGYSIVIFYNENNSSRKATISFNNYIPNKEAKFLKQKGVKLLLNPIERFSIE